MTPASDDSQRPRQGLYDRVGLALVLGVAALVGLSAIRSWDLWWHLLTGRLSLEQGSILPTDVLSMTRSGEPWVYKDLGADILFWLIYDLGGEWGLAAFKLVVALLCVALCLGLAHRRGASNAWVLLLAGTAFVIAGFRIIVRPDVLSLLSLGALLWGLERWRRQAAPRRLDAGFWGLVGLSLVWANLHRGVVLGIAILAAYALYELASAVEASRRSDSSKNWLASPVVGSQRPVAEAGRSVLLAVLAGGATLLNPSGLALWRQSLAVGRSDQVARVVSEWQALGVGGLLDEFPVAWVWMLLTPSAVLVAFWLSRRRGGGVDLWDVALAVGGVVLGLRAVRLLAPMALITLGPLAAATATLMARQRRRASRRAPWAAVAGLVVVALAWRDPHLVLSRPGFAEDWYPERAVELIATGPIAGEGYTSFRFAGYMVFHLWPDKHTVCDGRFDQVYDAPTIEACLAAPRDEVLFESLRERYDLQWVLTQNRAAVDAAQPWAFDFLAGDEAWSLVHWDAAALLWVRNAGPNEVWARERAYQLLRPHEPDVSLLEAVARTRGHPIERARLDREVRRLQQAAPDDYRTHIVAALYLHGIGASDSEEFRLVVALLRLDYDENPAAIEQVLDWVGEAP